MLHIREGATVEFSDMATVAVPDGRIYSPFQRDSYVARVVLEGDGTVIVVLPKHAKARRPEGSWVNDVVKAAGTVVSNYGNAVVVMEDE